MAQVKFTPNLKQFFPDLQTVQVEAETVAEVVSAVDQRWEGLADYIVDERGRLRKHVNIFVGTEMLLDREGLSDSVDVDTRLYIMQALSGG